MPYEAGGRADKFGNRYEMRVVISHLLEVIEEKISYVVVEALGDDEKGIDILVGHIDGSKEGIQCKGRNGSKNYWNYGSLNSLDIFSKWRYQLGRDNRFKVTLATPLSFQMLEDLISRTLNSSGNPNDFYNNQVINSSKEFRDFFNNICKAFSVDYKIENEIEQLINYLNRIRVCQIPDTSLKDIIIDKISLLFINEAKMVYENFVSWIVDGDILGMKITSYQISKFIEENNILLKDLSNDKRIIPRISELNREFKESFVALNGGLFYREEFDLCIDEINKGKSLVVHGKAGYGKSGCTQYLINFCDENKIRYISIQLDKRIPSVSAEHWGKNLGLSASIVQCIHSITKEEPAIIILDQLDALRWTQTHSGESLIVCSEIISQVARINLEREHKISVVLVCRTFDIENDRNIKKLFEERINEEYLEWSKILINELDDNQVKLIIGSEYDNLSKKIKKLLKTPSNLYVWQHIEKNSINKEFSTANQLILEWWNQLTKKYINLGYNETNLQETKTALIDQFIKIGRLYIPERLLTTSKVTIDFLCSNSFLIVQEGKIFFTHQTIYDCFIALKMFSQFYDGAMVSDIVGEVNLQTPGRRYQIQMFMQSLLDVDSKDLVRFGIQMLNADGVRFYNKCIFFEILNQIEIVDLNIREFVNVYSKNEFWGKYIVNNVIYSKPQYYRVLRDYGVIEDWLKNDIERKKAIRLLESIKPFYEEIDVQLIEKYAMQSETMALEFSGCFYSDFNNDTDEFFDLRMQIYYKFPKLNDYYHDIRKLFRNSELRAIRYLVFLLENKIKNKERMIYWQESEFVDESSDIIINNSLELIELLLPFVPKSVESEYIFSDWSARYGNTSIERVCINLLKKANKSTILNNFENFINIYMQYFGKGYIFINELILDALLYFPEHYNNFIIDYISEDLEKNIIDITSGNKDKLKYAKLIIERNSKNCDVNVLDKLIGKLIKFLPSNAVITYRERIKYNKENKGDRAYWSYWGDLQYELLRYIPYERLNKTEKDLIRVLERKFCDKETIYNHKYSHSGSVSSPVTGKNISLVSWQRIITNPKLTTSKKKKLIENEKGFIDSSIDEFARSFKSEVETNPVEIINMILNTKTHIEDIFIDSLFSGIAYGGFLNNIPIYLIENLIAKYNFDFVSYRANYFCSIISRSDYVDWSNQIVEILKSISINHTNPIGNTPNVKSQQDVEMLSYDMLITNSINCVRGNAAHAIGHILWKRDACFELFKDSILKLSRDDNSAVQLASLFSLWPCLNIQKEWACEIILSLFETDYRLAGFSGSRDFFLDFYDKYKYRIVCIIEKLFNSDDEELVKVGSYSLLEMYLFNNEFIDVLTDVSKMNKNQAENILYMAVLYYDKTEYNKIVKDIILMFKDSDFDLETPFSRLFYDNLIDLKRDKEFLIEVMTSKINRRTLNAFIKYIEEGTHNLMEFSEIIIEMSKQLINSFSNEDNRLYGIDDALTKLIIGLYDETIVFGIDRVNELSNSCLDLWDKMYEYQIGSAITLSQAMIDR